MANRKLLSVVGFCALGPLVPLAGCEGGLLDPALHVDGLTFFGDSRVVFVRPDDVLDSFIEVTVSVRNSSTRPIQRTLLGGCIIERVAAFRAVDGDLTLAWDSDRAGSFGCTDDLVLVDLLSGERLDPPTWRVGVSRSAIRDSLPAGRYAMAVWIRPGEELERLGVGEVDLP